jgi:transcription antitermination factor NusA-like protein
MRINSISNEINRLNIDIINNYKKHMSFLDQFS